MGRTLLGSLVALLATSAPASAQLEVEITGPSDSFLTFDFGDVTIGIEGPRALDDHFARVFSPAEFELRFGPDTGIQRVDPPGARIVGTFGEVPPEELGVNWAPQIGGFRFGVAVEDAALFSATELPVGVAPDTLNLEMLGRISSTDARLDGASIQFTATGRYPSGTFDPGSETDPAGLRGRFGEGLRAAVEARYDDLGLLDDPGDELDFSDPDGVSVSIGGFPAVLKGLDGAEHTLASLSSAAPAAFANLLVPAAAPIVELAPDFTVRISGPNVSGFGTGEVNVVPLPGAWLVFATGVLGLGAYRRLRT